MWQECSYMSSARIGRPPASVVVWSAADRFTHSGKLGAPAVDAAKIACNSFGQGPARCSASTQPIEIKLMQDHRVRRDQLFTLQPVDHKYRRLGKIHLGELAGNRVEPPHRARVIILIMADQQFFGQTFDVATRRKAGKSSAALSPASRAQPDPPAHTAPLS